MNTFFYDSYILVLLFLLPGAFLGAVYDVFRILRIARTRDISVSGAFFEKIRPKRPLFSNGKTKIPRKRLIRSETVLIFLEDILFFLIAAVTVILYTFHTNGGELRIICLLASVFGFILYFQSVGRLTPVVAKQIIFLDRCFLHYAAYVLLVPLRFFVSALLKGYRLTVGKMLLRRHMKKQNLYSERMKRRWLDAARCGLFPKGKEV